MADAACGVVLSQYPTGSPMKNFIKEVYYIQLEKEAELCLRVSFHSANKGLSHQDTCRVSGFCVNDGPGWVKSWHRLCILCFDFLLLRASPGPEDRYFSIPRATLPQQNAPYVQGVPIVRQMQ